MRNLFFLLVSANFMNMMIGSLAYSQSDYSRTPFRRFTNLSAGATYNITTALEKDLSATEFLGDGTRLNSFTEIFGLGYYSMRNSGWITGVSGYFYHLRSAAVNGQVNLKTANVFFNLGYCVVNSDQWAAFPYVGIGFTGMNFRVANTGEHKDIIIYRDTISAGKEAKFDAGGAALDLGFAIRLNRGDAKIMKAVYPMIGIDIGSSIFPSFAYWLSHSRHDTILSLSSPFLIAPYLRVTVGIGRNVKKSAQIDLN